MIFSIGELVQYGNLYDDFVVEVKSQYTKLTKAQQNEFDAQGYVAGHKILTKDAAAALEKEEQKVNKKAKLIVVETNPFKVTPKEEPVPKRDVNAVKSDMFDIFMRALNKTEELSKHEYNVFSSEDLFKIPKGTLSDIFFALKFDDWSDSSDLEDLWKEYVDLHKSRGDSATKKQKPVTEGRKPKTTGALKDAGAETGSLNQPNAQKTEVKMKIYQEDKGKDCSLVIHLNGTPNAKALLVGELIQIFPETQDKKFQGGFPVRFQMLKKGKSNAVFFETLGYYEIKLSQDFQKLLESLRGQASSKPKKVTIQEDLNTSIEESKPAGESSKSTTGTIKNSQSYLTIAKRGQTSKELLPISTPILKDGGATVESGQNLVDPEGQYNLLPSQKQLGTLHEVLASLKASHYKKVLQLAISLREAQRSKETGTVST